MHNTIRARRFRRESLSVAQIEHRRRKSLSTSASNRTTPVNVNESFANRNFPERSSIGARFKYGQLNDKGYWYTIVGVVKEIREVGMEEELRPAVYRLHEQPTRS